ncbi:hypothetical protein ACTXT7_001840 [Hymenolepis weldensis]
MWLRTDNEITCDAFAMIFLLLFNKELYAKVHDLADEYKKFRILVVDVNLEQDRELREFNLKGSKNDLSIYRSSIRNHLACIRSSHSQDFDFVNSIIKIEIASYEDAASRIVPKLATKKVSAVSFLRAVEQDEAEIDTGSDITVVSPKYGKNLEVPLLLEKTISKEHYNVDRTINFVGLSRIDKLNLIRYSDEKKTCQAVFLELTNVENQIKGYNRCHHVAKIPHPTIPIYLLKLDSSRTQVHLTISRPTKGVTYLTVSESIRNDLMPIHSFAYY